MSQLFIFNADSIYQEYLISPCEPIEERRMAQQSKNLFSYMGYARIYEDMGVLTDIVGSGVGTLDMLMYSGGENAVTSLGVKVTIKKISLRHRLHEPAAAMCGLGGYTVVSFTAVQGTVRHSHSMAFPRGLPY